jgi:subtilisin family serine protease
MILITISILAAGLAIWLGAGKTPASGDKNGRARAENGGNMAASEENLALYAVELKGPLSDAERAALAGKVDWAGDISSETALVRAGSEQLEELKDLPFVKNVHKYTPESKLAGELQDRGDKRENISEKIIVTVTLVSPGDKPPVLELVNRLGGRVLDGASGQDRYLRAEIPGGALDKLAASPRVLFVEKDLQAEFLNDRARDIVGARPLAVPNFISGTGLTGRGQTIGLADSGLDTGKINDLHPDLQNTPGQKPRIVMLKSWAGRAAPADTLGHGTHMAGTLVGSGKASAGKYAGVAPEASLYFQGVVNSRGELELPVNLETLYNPAYQADVRVYVNGWGRKLNGYSSATAQIDDFIRRKPDFLTIFGSGNFGPAQNTITTEANSKNALVVGATSSPRPAFDPEHVDTNSAVDFSSRGPTADGRIKPELLAPGTSIISTRSSLVKGNLPGRDEYTMMQGTSMASAVAGGAAALLRQYFEDEARLAVPSAALLKAALINGAGMTGDNPYAGGFGVINLTQTVVSLKDKLVLFDDNFVGVKNGEYIEYKYTVESPERPVKVTLAWTDPAAVPGAKKTLVNNLDLIVTTPGGVKYFGNDHIHPGRPDDINNVEQVYIEDPEPGVYTIRVIGKSVTRSATLAGAGMLQDYALVYGQPAHAAEVAEFKDGNESLLLEDGSRYSVKDKKISCVVNDRLATADAGHVLPGTQMYAGPDSVYFVTRFWREYGLQLKKTSGGLLWSGLNRDGEEGGYYSDTRDGHISVNGDDYRETPEVPPGFEVGASINPLTQVIKQADIRYVQIEGFVQALNPEQKTISLINQKNPYEMSGSITYLFDDKFIDTDPVDAAFGPVTATRTEKVAPGMPVRLVIAPSVSRVQAIAAKRTVVTGVIENADPGAGKLIMNGKTYHVLPGTPVFQDDREVGLAGVVPGILATLVLMNEKDQVVEVNAYAKSVTGQVTYLQEKEGTLFLQDINGKTYSLKLTPSTTIRRWGLESDINALSEGLWVRAILSPDGKEARQINVAETLRVEGKQIASYNKEKNMVTTTDGASLYLGRLSRAYKNGFPLPLREITPGNKADVVSLLTPRPVAQAALILELSDKQKLPGPELRVSGIPFENDYWITGETSGKRLYLYKGEGVFEQVGLTPSGQFALSYVPAGNEQYLELVAVDGETGAVTGTRVNLAGKSTGWFVDTAGHWAEADLNAMAREGLISGLPGNKFMPDRPVTRVEFAAMLARAFGWYSTQDRDVPFRDRDLIPTWAKQAVGGAVERKIVAGYPDGTFRPEALITRAEQSAILARVMALHSLEVNGSAGLDFSDVAKIPPWAGESVAKACAAGIMKGRDGKRFDPGAPATRAEAAVTIYRLLQQVRGLR